MRIAFLQNAYGIKTTIKHNSISSLEFKIPANDPKTSLIEQMTFVRYVDDEGNKSDYYRVVEEPQRFTEEDDEDVSFYCEHGFITLIDKVMFGTYVVGGSDYLTPQVLEWILSKQTTPYWQLGACDFSRQFEYSWSQENLLSAIFSVPNAFDQPYRFTFDMNTTPWTLNLELFDDIAEPKYYVNKKINQLKVKTSKDSKQLATKIYPLGFGEGVNQLTISDVNAGVPYLIAPPEIVSIYGEIEKVVVDRRFQNAQHLKEYAQNLLNQYMQPYKEYEIKVVDLFTANGAPDKLPTTGDVIYVVSGGLRLYATEIVSFPDDEGETVVRVANKSRDVSGTMASLSERQRIEQVYAQGATNIFSYSFRDNADPTHGLVESFYIPREALIINSVQFKYELRRFRSYEKATLDGGGVLRTTGAGGGDVRTSESNAGVEVSTMNGGGGVVSSRNGGGETKSSSPSDVFTSMSADLSTGLSTAFASGSGGTGNTGTGGGHDHNSGSYAVSGKDVTGVSSFVASHTHSGPSHTHSVLAHSHPIGQHTHTLNSHTHTVAVSAHTHDVELDQHSHAVDIPSHTHSVTLLDHTHEIDIPDHTHQLEHGIYESGIGSSVIVKVDGVEIPMTATYGEIDISMYLAVDDSGKIRRGTYHDVEIIPDALSGIVGSITAQLFIQSLGGGDY